MFSDGTASKTNPWIEAAAKIGKLVEPNDEYDIVAATKSYAE